jgi:hypothetical protein
MHHLTAHQAALIEARRAARIPGTTPVRIGATGDWRNAGKGSKFRRVCCKLGARIPRACGGVREGSGRRYRCNNGGILADRLH